MDKLTFETVEEILRDGIAARGTFWAHVLGNHEVSERLPVGGGGILHAAIRMKDESGIWILSKVGYAQGFQGKRHVDTFGKGILNDFPDASILDDCQVEPSHPGRNKRDVSHPNLIWRISMEMAF